MTTRKQAHNNNPKNVLLGLLAGSLAGAAAMLLLAPQSGKRTRAQIQQKSVQLRDRTTRTIKEAVTQVLSKTRRITAEVREKAEQLMHLGQDKLVERLDRLSAALDAGKTTVEVA